MFRGKWVYHTKMGINFYSSLWKVGNTFGFYDFFKSKFFQTILVSNDVEFNEKLHDI